LEGSFSEVYILEGSSMEISKFFELSIPKNNYFWKAISSEIEILPSKLFFQFLLKYTVLF